MSSSTDVNSAPVQISSFFFEENLKEIPLENQYFSLIFVIT